MSELKQGDKVKYLHNDKWYNGVIHAVRKIDFQSSQHVLSYLIDTGKDTRVDEIVTPKEVDNIYIRQPQQVDVLAKDVKLR